MMPTLKHLTGLVAYRRSMVAAIAIIIIALAGLSAYGVRQNFLLCDMECGETLIAVNAANQYRDHGVQFGLLENTSSFEQPLLYTHNVNIGDFLFIGLEALGLTDFWEKCIGPLFAHGLGLFYVFLTVSIYTDSSLAALCVLGVFASTYWGYGAFALNPLRAWHAPALFMIAFHVGRWSTPGRRPVGDAVGIFIGAILAFGCGYDFWVICGAVALCLLVSQAIRYSRPDRRQPTSQQQRDSASHNRFILDVRMPQALPQCLTITNRNGSIASQRSTRKFITSLLLIAVAFALPFLLRQIQIIFALGSSYWWQDLLFSLAIKIPGASQVIDIPSIAKVDEFYVAHHVFRPPATPSNDWRQILDTAYYMATAITIPRWGSLTIVFTLLMLVVGLSTRSGLLPARWRPTSAIASAAGFLLLPLVIGICLGLAMFAPFSLHVYLKHEFPLLGFAFMLTRGVLLSWSIAVCRRYWGDKRSLVTLCLVILIALDQVLLQVGSTTRGFYPNFEFRQFINQHPHSHVLLSTFMQSFPADQIYGFSSKDVEYAYPYDPVQNLKQIESGIQDGGLGLPDYWIYQPVDQRVTFDNTHPSCRWRDWLTTIVENLSPTQSHPTLRQPWVSPVTVGVGSTVSFGGTVDDVGRGMSFDLVTQHPLVQAAEPSYNCIYRTLVAWATARKPEVSYSTIELLARRANGVQSALYSFAVETTAKLGDVQPIGPFVPSQPSLSAMIAAAPDLRVVERSDRGIGYVIFKIPRRQESP